MIEPDHPRISTARQCRLLGLPRSTYYRRPRPTPPDDLALMRQIDQVYLAHPEFGSRQMARWLRRQGHEVNRKRVQRLMRLMGLEAIYQKPNLSRRNPEHPVYPYLLRNLKVTRPNQVWAMDTCYIPIQGGFLYL
jgi:putative transposase